MTIAPPAVLKRLAELPLARFATVGLISAVVDFVAFAVLVFGANVAPAPSNAISYALSLVANFNLNRRWTFKQEKDPKVAARQGGRFLVAKTGGLLLSTAIVGGLNFGQKLRRCRLSLCGIIASRGSGYSAMRR